MMKKVAMLVSLVLAVALSVSAWAGSKKDNAEKLFQAKCSVCHSAELPLHMKKDRAAWEKTVKQMQAKRPGLISDQNAKTIVDFLVTHAGKQ